jgi:hypothetical protein
VHEEACARIVDAGLLGFTTGEVVNGPEKGLVLVRAVWSAVVALDEWKPLHEIRHRILVPPNEVMGRLDLPPDRVRIARRWLYEAMKQRGRD